MRFEEVNNCSRRFFTSPDRAYSSRFLSGLAARAGTRKPRKPEPIAHKKIRPNCLSRIFELSL